MKTERERARERRIHERVEELYKRLGPAPVGTRGWTRWARATFEVDAQLRQEQQAEENKQ